MKRAPVAIPAITTPSSFPSSRGECKIQSKFHLCLPPLSLSCPQSIPLDWMLHSSSFEMGLRLLSSYFFSKKSSCRSKKLSKIPSTPNFLLQNISKKISSNLVHLFVGGKLRFRTKRWYITSKDIASTCREIGVFAADGTLRAYKWAPCSHAGAAWRASHSAIDSHWRVSCRYVCIFVLGRPCTGCTGGTYWPTISWDELTITSSAPGREEQASPRYLFIPVFLSHSSNRS